MDIITNFYLVFEDQELKIVYRFLEEKQKTISMNINEEFKLNEETNRVLDSLCNYNVEDLKENDSYRKFTNYVLSGSTSDSFYKQLDSKNAFKNLLFIASNKDILNNLNSCLINNKTEGDRMVQVFVINFFDLSLIKDFDFKTTCDFTQASLGYKSNNGKYFPAILPREDFFYNLNNSFVDYDVVSFKNFISYFMYSDLTNSQKELLVDFLNNINKICKKHKIEVYYKNIKNIINNFIILINKGFLLEDLINDFIKYSFNETSIKDSYYNNITNNNFFQQDIFKEGFND